MKKWLVDLLEGRIKKDDDPHKYIVYMGRIREYIDRDLDNLVWLATYYPDIITDEDYEIRTEGIVKRRRMRKLMQVLELIAPPDVQAVLQRKKEERDQEIL
jgi:hypothetical protein